MGVKMKILLISSSPHGERSRTFFLAKKVLKFLLEKKIAVEIVHLCDLKIEFCRHCEACHKKIMSCPIKDGLGSVLKKMLEADGIILASPNYINQVNAPMKALFDRSSHFLHCRRLLGKYIAGVVSSGSGNDKEVLDYLEFYAHACGAQYSGGLSSAAVVVEKKSEDAVKLSKKFAEDLEEKRRYPKQLVIVEKGKEYFKKIIQMRKNHWIGEYQYWRDSGWI